MANALILLLSRGYIPDGPKRLFVNHVHIHAHHLYE